MMTSPAAAISGQESFPRVSRVFYGIIKQDGAVLEQSCPAEPEVMTEQ